MADLFDAPTAASTSAATARKPPRIAQPRVIRPTPLHAASAAEQQLQPAKKAAPAAPTNKPAAKPVPDEADKELLEAMRLLSGEEKKAAPAPKKPAAAPVKDEKKEDASALWEGEHPDPSLKDRPLFAAKTGAKKSTPAKAAKKPEAETEQEVDKDEQAFSELFGEPEPEPETKKAAPAKTPARKPAATPAKAAAKKVAAPKETVVEQPAVTPAKAVKKAAAPVVAPEVEQPAVTPVKPVVPKKVVVAKAAPKIAAPAPVEEEEQQEEEQQETAEAEEAEVASEEKVEEETPEAVPEPEQEMPQVADEAPEPMAVEKPKAQPKIVPKKVVVEVPAAASDDVQMDADEVGELPAASKQPQRAVEEPEDVEKSEQTKRARKRPADQQGGAPAKKAKTEPAAPTFTLVAKFLAPGVNELHLVNFFNRFGLSTIGSRATGVGDGRTVFVKFATKSARNEALRIMSENQCHLGSAMPDMKEWKNSVIVQGAPVGTAEADVRKFFVKCGEISDVFFERPRGNRRDVVVNFEKPESLDNALQMSGATLRGTAVSVSRPTSTLSKNTCVTVFYLPEAVTAAELQKVFGDCEVNLRPYLHAAMLSFKTEDEAKAVLERKDVEVCGASVLLMPGINSHRRDMQVHVVGLPWDVEERTLGKFFLETVGQEPYVRVVYSKTGSAIRAFASFSSAEFVNKAVEQSGVSLNESALRIERASA